LKGDGEQAGGNRAGWLWCSEKQQADAYTHMAVVRGLAASYHPELTEAGKTVYRVSVRDTQWITSDPGDPRATKITLEPPLPGEVVWCIRNRNSTLVTRRNGKIVILGNCNTVTHILGVRAFGTQLLCEQVVGRGLRRMSYTLNEHGHFDPEYAEVYGVPFSFIPCAGTGTAKKPGTPKPGRVKALPERLALRPWLEITFPRLAGYRYELPPARLEAKFTDQSRVVLSTADLPTRTEGAPIVGESVIYTLDDLKKRREQEVAFGIARLVLNQYSRADNGQAAGGTNGAAAEGAQVWLFPQVLAIVKRWLAECVRCKDNTFPQLLLLVENAHKAAEKIHRAIAAASPGEARVRAVLQPYDALGTTAGVSFDTTKQRWTTAADRCHINFVPCDSGWEAKFAQALEEMEEVRAYAKNQNLGFKIPYTFEGRPGNYYPDYLLRVDDGRGADDLLSLVVEITGQELQDKEAKVDTARKLWVPAVNAEAAFGHWAFLEITDPWDAQNTIRAFLSGARA
jgi:type III restriction enzyme